MARGGLYLGPQVQAGVFGAHQPQLLQAHEADAGGQLGGQVHAPDVLQAAERHAVEQQEGRAQHGEVVPAPHDPDEAGPEQQHEGQPAVVGDAPHLGGAKQDAAARRGCPERCESSGGGVPPCPLPYHHGNEGADVALLHDDVPQRLQGQPLRRTLPAWSRSCEPPPPEPLCRQGGAGRG